MHPRKEVDEAHERHKHPVDRREVDARCDGHGEVAAESDAEEVAERDDPSEHGGEAEIDADSLLRPVGGEEKQEIDGGERHRNHGVDGDHGIVHDFSSFPRTFGTIQCGREAQGQALPPENRLTNYSKLSISQLRPQFKCSCKIGGRVKAVFFRVSNTIRTAILSYKNNIISVKIIVFYYFKSRCYSTDRKKKREVRTMKKLEMFLEEYFEICAHK